MMSGEKIKPQMRGLGEILKHPWRGQAGERGGWAAVAGTWAFVGNMSYLVTRPDVSPREGWLTRGRLRLSEMRLSRNCGNNGWMSHAHKH